MVSRNLCIRNLPVNENCTNPFWLRANRWWIRPKRRLSHDYFEWITKIIPDNRSNVLRTPLSQLKAIQWGLKSNLEGLSRHISSDFVCHAPAQTDWRSCWFMRATHWFIDTNSTVLFNYILRFLLINRQLRIKWDRLSVDNCNGFLIRVYRYLVKIKVFWFHKFWRKLSK